MKEAIILALSVVLAAILLIYCCELVRSSKEQVEITVERCGENSLSK